MLSLCFQMNKSKFSRRNHKLCVHAFGNSGNNEWNSTNIQMTFYGFHRWQYNGFNVKYHDVVSPSLNRTHEPQTIKIKCNSLRVVIMQKRVSCLSHIFIFFVNFVFLRDADKNVQFVTQTIGTTVDMNVDWCVSGT